MANDRISIDISLCDGWFPILNGGQEESLIYQNRMIIGHLEDDALEKNNTLAKASVFQNKIGGNKVKAANKEEFEKMNMFGTGIPNDGYAQYFDGKSFLNVLVDPKTSPLFLANVTFEPGCRNHWHIHHASKGGGQILICTAGEGWYQEEGKPAQSLTPGKEARKLMPGDVVYIAPNIKHWHGATKDSWFSHISLEVPGENTSNEWLEPVDADAYEAL